MTINAVATRDNALLMAECAELGYLNGTVLDATYGLGAFWKRWQPDHLIRLDRFTKADLVADARRLPFRNYSIDSVVYDPPYKLNGTSTGFGPSALDARYGVASGYRSIAEKHALLLDGTVEALRVAKRFVLVKCADQIASGKYNPQTFMVWERAVSHGATLVDLLYVVGGREQPPGTRQLHARRNHSALLVFRP